MYEFFIILILEVGFAWSVGERFTFFHNVLKTAYSGRVENLYTKHDF